jgi:hypothetical protein
MRSGELFLWHYFASVVSPTFKYLAKNSTMAKVGMPIRHEGRNLAASPEELNRWLQRTSGEAAGVHVVTPGSNLLKDLRASVAAQKEAKDRSNEFKIERKQLPVVKTRRTRASHKP